jgi:uncharacterized membrane protein
MTWLQRYRVCHYFTGPIWILPLLSMVAALAAVPLLHGIEEAMGWESGINPETARALLGTMAASLEPAGILSGEPTSTVINRKDGVVLAFDIQGLASMAQRADCILEMVPQVGDFVAIGDPLFRVFRGGATLRANALRQSIAEIPHCVDTADEAIAVFPGTHRNAVTTS